MYSLPTTDFIGAVKADARMPCIPPGYLINLSHIAQPLLSDNNRAQYVARYKVGNLRYSVLIGFAQDRTNHTSEAYLNVIFAQCDYIGENKRPVGLYLRKSKRSSDEAGTRCPRNFKDNVLDLYCNEHETCYRILLGMYHAFEEWGVTTASGTKVNLAKASDLLNSEFAGIKISGIAKDPAKAIRAFHPSWMERVETLSLDKALGIAPTGHAFDTVYAADLWGTPLGVPPNDGFHRTINMVHAMWTYHPRRIGRTALFDAEEIDPGPNGPGRYGIWFTPIPNLALYTDARVPFDDCQEVIHALGLELLNHYMDGLRHDPGDPFLRGRFWYHVLEYGGCFQHPHKGATDWRALTADILEAVNGIPLGSP